MSTSAGVSAALNQNPWDEQAIDLFLPPPQQAKNAAGPPCGNYQFMGEGGGTPKFRDVSVLNL